MEVKARIVLEQQIHRDLAVVGKRLQAIDVETIGQTRNPGQAALVLIRSDEIEEGEFIAVTHLPNAVSGLKVEYDVD